MSGAAGPAGKYKIFIWLTSDNMHHQWLLLAACFWVIFMFMVASKFITLTFKDPDVYGVKQEQLILTAMTKVEKIQVPEEKCLPEEIQPTGKVFSEDLMHQPLVHVKRIELLRNVCRDAALRNLSHTTISKFVLDRIFVCDKHKILFCQTPKVGNTQWKKVLIVLNGAFSSIEEIPENIVHDHEKNGLPRLSSFSDSEIQKRDQIQDLPYGPCWSSFWIWDCIATRADQSSTLGKQEMQFKSLRGFSCLPGQCIRVQIAFQSSHSGALWDTTRRPIPSICSHTNPNPTWQYQFQRYSSRQGGVQKPVLRAHYINIKGLVVWTGAGLNRFNATKISLNA
ncbi:carbohydrate sulfotransferase 10 isoform X4 [Gopherus flavomarginatus]|uniref:carbohydrate sulfotransferase 10 isoform X4 n=1 Tax=Gopherus flavomarginatus TaxID=286002 RepID=UPI0021CBC1B6|nr:carbohydrate sulfotransferase 10 isoform X4 [Gopherus flavomarginatus]